MAKTVRDWNVEQSWLLPPSVMDFVLADHLAHFVRHPKITIFIHPGDCATRYRDGLLDREP